MPTLAPPAPSIALDAQVLARGWRAVGAASTKHPSAPLDHTISIEVFPLQGLRLTATDTCRLLTTWVPCRGCDTEPGLDEVAPHSAVVIDQYGRAKSLLAHMANLAAQPENDGLQAVVRLFVPWEPPKGTPTALPLAELDIRAVDIEYVGHERLHLPIYAGSYVPWHDLLAAFTPRRTQALKLSQDTLDLIAKATKPFGESCEVALTFGGENRPIGIAFGIDPVVRGLLMPLQWDFDADAPAEPVQQ